MGCALWPSEQTQGCPRDGGAGQAMLQKAFGVYEIFTAVSSQVGSLVSSVCFLFIRKSTLTDAALPIVSVELWGPVVPSRK